MVRHRRSNIPRSHTRRFCVTDTMNVDEVADVIALSIVRGTVGVQGGASQGVDPKWPDMLGWKPTKENLCGKSTA
jgi:hypothetical protein